jgi:protein-S-isoprenylcysteine O-methyltransferase Ste14
MSEPTPSPDQIGSSDPTDAAAPDHPGVIMRPPLLYAGTLVLAALLERVIALPLDVEPARWIIVAAAGALGLILAGGGTTLFRRHGTNVQTHKPSTTVVTTGPYRFSRNPIYLGLTALYVAVAVAMNSGWALIGLAPLLLVMRYGVIEREERYLEAKFGEAYRTYKARVRRWL